MAEQFRGDLFQYEAVGGDAGSRLPGEPKENVNSWYFSMQELKDHTPSRKDGIKWEEESHMRKLYCSFLQELGMELQVPQVTIATAMMFCHRFYMQQSLAKNCWQTIGTVCMFLGCKAEETPRRLNDLIVVAYKLIFKWDPSAPRRIEEKEVYDMQKQLIINGERLLLATLAFNLNIEHPYKPLVAALKRLEISDKELPKVAWNFVNDWLHTTLCLQYKPHYIAAGSIFLAAKILKVKLPKEKGRVWWMQFDVAPKRLEEVVQQMLRFLEQNHRQPPPPSKLSALKPTVRKEIPSSPQSCGSGSVAQDSAVVAPVAKFDDLNDLASSNSCGNRACDSALNNLKETGHSELIAINPTTSSLQSCITSDVVVAQDSCFLTSMVGADGIDGSILSRCNKSQESSDNVRDGLAETSLRCQASDSGSAVSVVDDCEGEPVAGKSDLNSSYKIVSLGEGSAKIDVNRIRETFRKRKNDGIVNRKSVEDKDDVVDSEAWIERELENGIMVDSDPSDKQRRL